jgi:hypothetical protein
MTLISIAGAAARLRTTADGVLDLIAAGTLVAVRHRGRLLVIADEVFLVGARVAERGDDPHGYDMAADPPAGGPVWN